MCADCLDLLANKFASQKDFENFEDKLQRKCNEDKLAITDSKLNNTIALFRADSHYQCNNCEEVWLLSIPENAWRGFFLPKQQATEYINRIAKEDKRREIGCWAILAIAILIVLWYLIK